MIEIKKISDNKTDFMDLLLIADEQESMIMKYLDSGDMFVMENDGRICAICIVTDKGGDVCELKNIAVSPNLQRRGYGRQLIDFIEKQYKNKFYKLIVGTGDSPMTIPFYEKCGFVRTHVVKDFFIDNYDHPIFENGVQLKDMIYLEKKFI